MGSLGTNHYYSSPNGVVTAGVLRRHEGFIARWYWGAATAVQSKDITKQALWLPDITEDIGYTFFKFTADLKARKHYKKRIKELSVSNRQQEEKNTV